MVTLEHIAGSALAGVRNATAAASPTEDAAIAQRVRAATIPFSWPMRLLPASRRKAMQALYAFCREVSGIADGEASWTMKLALLGGQLSTEQLEGRKLCPKRRLWSAPVTLCISLSMPLMLKRPMFGQIVIGLEY